MAEQSARIAADMTQTPPLSEEGLYLFEVKSEAPYDYIKGTLSSLKEIRQSFRVIGENTYYLVAKSSDASVLRKVQFPAGSEVKQVPIQPFKDFVGLFGVRDERYEEPPAKQQLDDQVLTMNVWRIVVPPSTSTEEYNALMKRWCVQYAECHSICTEVVGYAAIATYPATVYFWTNLSDSVLQAIIQDGLPNIQGPGDIQHAYKRVVKMPV